MNEKKAMLALVAVFAAGGLFAGIEIVSPRAGETVEQLWPEVKAFLDLSREMRQTNSYRISEQEKKVFKACRGAKPVVFAWTGETNGVYELTVKRLPDGRVFHKSVVTGITANVEGRLEVGREWAWTVSNGKSEASGRFFTEDRAPRIISFDGVRNARDIGGWKGLDGRRVKQGVAFRTGGLNKNAQSVYYTYDEILELHKQGKLVGAGVGKNAARLSREYAAKLDSGRGIDKNFLRLIKSAPQGPGEEVLSAADRDYLLNDLKVKSDIDFREDWETFGMLFSPIDKSVNWFHYPTFSGYQGFVSPTGRACQALQLGVFMSESNLPAVFHCIGGTDRTGTFTYLLNAFLGVCEEDLIRDYEMSFIAGGGVDKRHYGWLMGLVEAVRALPGDTLADKVYGYYLSLGFTEEQLNDLRERLLEAEPSK